MTSTPQPNGNKYSQSCKAHQDAFTAFGIPIFRTVDEKHRTFIIRIVEKKKHAKCHLML